MARASARGASRADVDLRKFQLSLRPWHPTMAFRLCDLSLGLGQLVSLRSDRPPPGRGADRISKSSAPLGNQRAFPISPAG